jgi:FMN-dependent NADH-azoreductase
LNAEDASAGAFKGAAVAKILHDNASPRGWRSFSYQIARAFLDRLSRRNPQFGLDTLDLFSADLPEFAAPAAAAKYAVMSGQEPRDKAAEAWKRVIEVIGRFKSAEIVVISCPMWNFSIPYPLKHYIDVIVQPALTFSYSPDEGYKGLLTGRTAVLCLARGGRYPSGTEAGAMDMQKPYLEMVLRFIGFADIREVTMEETMSGGRTVDENLQDAIGCAERLADELAAR